MTDHERAERLNEIKDEVKELMTEALRLVRGTREEPVARSYWYAHIACALDQEHEYASRQIGTMQESIASLEEGDGDDGTV